MQWNRRAGTSGAIVAAGLIAACGGAKTETGNIKLKASATALSGTPVPTASICYTANVTVLTIGADGTQKQFGATQTLSAKAGDNAAIQSILSCDAKNSNGSALVEFEITELNDCNGNAYNTLEQLPMLKPARVDCLPAASGKEASIDLNAEFNIITEDFGNIDFTGTVSINEWDETYKRAHCTPFLLSENGIKQDTIMTALSASVRRDKDKCGASPIVVDQHSYSDPKGMAIAARFQAFGGYDGDINSYSAAVVASEGTWAGNRAMIPAALYASKAGEEAYIRNVPIQRSRINIDKADTGLQCTEAIKTTAMVKGNVFIGRGENAQQRLHWGGTGVYSCNCATETVTFFPPAVQGGTLWNAGIAGCQSACGCLAVAQPGGWQGQNGTGTALPSVASIRTEIDFGDHLEIATNNDQPSLDTPNFGAIISKLDYGEGQRYVASKNCSMESTQAIGLRTYSRESGFVDRIAIDEKGSGRWAFVNGDQAARWIKTCFPNSTF